MTQVNPPVISFAGGILGKLLQARVDLPFYAKGAEIMENWWPMVHGPMSRRPPLMYIDTFVDSTERGHQLPFLYTVEQSYNILMTPSGLRFYTQDGRIDTPVVTAAIAGGDFATATTNEALAATVTVSTTGSGSAANLHDGLTTTDWTSDATATQWVKFDLGSAKTLYYIWLTATASTPAYGAAAWVLQGSATGAYAGEEVALLTVTNDPPWAASERRRYKVTSPGSYQYYRVYITAVAGAVVVPPPPEGSGTGGSPDEGYIIMTGE